MPQSNNVASKSFKSLKTTLLTTFLSLGLSILLASVGLEAFFNYQAQQQSLNSQQKLIAKEAASQVKEFIQNKLSILDTTVHFEDLIAAKSDNRKLILDKLLGKDEAIRRILVLDNKKVELARASRLSNSETIKLEDKTLADIFDHVAKNEQKISSVYIDDVTSEPLITLAIPLTDVFGDFKGVLLAEVNLKFMWDLVGNLKIGQKGSAYVVDKIGNLIAYGDISRVLAREDITKYTEVSEFINEGKETSENTIHITKGINGDTVVTTFASIGTPDWALVVELPLSEAYQPLFTQIILSIVLVVTTALVATFLSIYLSNKITKPIVSLRDAAKNVSSGKLDINVENLADNEIGELAATFNEMGNRLQELYSGLEEKVKERTVNLEKKTLELEKTNQLMTGREIKMSELKDIIQDLKKKII